MEWLARSAHPEKGQSAQPYARHVLGVRAYGRRYLAPLEPVLPPTLLQALSAALFPAAEYHDLGKLEDENQSVLRGQSRAPSLPVIHSDAGTVHLLARNRFLAALLAASHHAGLPNLVREGNRGADCLRPEAPRERWTRTPIPALLARHREALGTVPDDPPAEDTAHGDLSVFCRMALSLLVDADHTDSSAPDQPLAAIEAPSPPPLLPAQRLAALDAYVSRFKPRSDRDTLRGNIYAGCRDAATSERIVACDSPVGSGKTTAVMAHLLAVARRRGLRRVFVVLPFTNIIRQSVETYRKALVLPGENPQDIVAEVHHLADFPDPASRDLAVRWNAPVVVTTAVAFFETLASATPSGLRRLHELAASAVFVDEAHAALPAKLLPVAWRWMQILADIWNVHWVLASGSLVRFWEMPEIRNASAPGKNPLPRSVPLLSPENLRDRAAGYEETRIRFETLSSPLAVGELQNFAASAPGPRLVILNTVQNAAVIARAFARSGNFSQVFHLSTALTPADRAKTLSEVKARLENDPDGNWVLVGTSCIEAGMDLDFASGFREMASLSSLLQASGRVNREGRRKDARMVSFRLADSAALNRNPGLEDPIRVLRGFFAENRPVSADLCTEALRRELRLSPGSESLLAKIVSAEEKRDFPEVERLFKVISSDTRTVIVDPDLVTRLESFQSVDWREIQRHSVQLWGTKLARLGIPEIANHPGCFKWTLPYSPFLGCMEGILDLQDFLRSGGGVL